MNWDLIASIDTQADIDRHEPLSLDALLVCNCKNAQILNAARGLVKTGGVLALRGGDTRILAEVFEKRWTHYFCKDDDVIWTRLCRCEGSSEVTWKEQSLAYYVELLQQGIPFSYLRYGDGEWNCALETMCPGYGFQEFTPELRKDIQDSLISYHRDPRYIMTLAPVHHLRDRGLVQWELITAFLREHNISDIEWACTEAFNRATCTGKLWPFVQHLQQHDIIIVGPKRNRPLQKIFPHAIFVDIPDKHCHSQLDKILRDVLAQKHPAIVLITAGPACVALIHKLWPHIGNRSTMIDWGSLWAPFLGRTEHGAHVNILKIPGLMKRNVGKFEEASIEELLWNCGDQTFTGCKVTQYWVDLALWEVFLNRCPDIASIIELGSEQCGLSLFLAVQAYQRGMEFRTLDHKWSENLRTPLARLLRLEEHFIRGNLFGEDVGGKLVNLLHGGLPRPILLFCDDGDKPRELREFVPHLQLGDYVGVHDWGTEIDQAHVAIFGDSLEPLWWGEWEAVGSITRFWRVVK